MRKVLVVAAHPADEVLACGGTIAAHIKAGDEVLTLILGEGVTARDERRDPQKRGNELLSLRQQCEKAAAILGHNKPIMLGLPDNRFDTVDLLDIIKAVEAVKKEFDPAIVYTHSACDLNVDNVLTNRAVTAAFRPLPASKAEGLFTFEVPSNTEWGGGRIGFLPNYFVDISSTISAKLAALAVYAGEVQKAPHPRCPERIRALAEWRGSSVGFTAAEAFYCVWQRGRIG